MYTTIWYRRLIRMHVHIQLPFGIEHCTPTIWYRRLIKTHVPFGRRLIKIHVHVPFGIED